TRRRRTVSAGSTGRPAGTVAIAKAVGAAIRPRSAIRPTVTTAEPATAASRAAVAFLPHQFAPRRARDHRRRRYAFADHGSAVGHDDSKRAIRIRELRLEQRV